MDVQMCKIHAVPPEKKGGPHLRTALLYPLYLTCVSNETHLFRQLLSVDHKSDQTVCIFFLVCDDLKLRDLTIGENIRHRYILGKLGFQVQSVSLSRHQFYSAFALVNGFKKTLLCL